ncbi:chitinase [Histoplasma capsulatum G186AR]|uniref:Endochitinase 1 n=2 Tax=Ajellomyces capsulatus TaxID=5037 RepID=C0NXS6_AJECG|nr:chitinase [Histoplasma capsulatum G186AR]EEH03594.1 chitinase [Histoplasma capsulatum G186AR]KAG5293832.1 chitinase [Histoplasma capsulatum]QSS75284.1 chitinase [Histoplasma capsulatum G186AR]
MSTYTVASGDSMWAIAVAHGISLDALIAANSQVSDPSQIEVGQVLNIPGRDAPANSAPAANVPPQKEGGGAPAAAPPAPSVLPSLPPPVELNLNNEGFKTVGYFTNWGIYGRNYQPLDIPGNHLTHILYSFANVKPDSGEVYLSDTYSDLEKHYPGDSWDESGENVYGCVKQLYLLKKHYRHLKTLLSIGGWTYSANFPAPASTPTGRQTFARTAVKLLADLGFDGIDIDWEYPQDDAQAHNFVLLLQETRRALDSYAAQHAQGKRLLLTVAVPCGPSNYKKLRMADMDVHLDFWNMMCYDFAGSWDSKAGHMANVFPSNSVPESTPFNADEAVTAYIAGGVHPKKLVFGLPLYGRAFENTDGPGKPFQGVGQGSWENGVWDYKVLPQQGSVEMNDHELIASWSYDKTARKMISYDTPTIAAAKVDHIRRRGMGGGMWWELSGDAPIGSERSLIAKTVKGFGGVGNLDHSMNLLAYPVSRYENMKRGFQ